MDRQEKAMLLLEIDETRQAGIRLEKKLNQYARSCENVKKAIEIFLNKSRFHSKYQDLDREVLVLPHVSGDKIRWDDVQKLQPERELSGIVKTAAELRDTMRKLDELNRRYPRG